VLQSTRFDALITDVRLGAFNGLQLAVIGRDTYPDIRLVRVLGI
jgi:YesN/AraC family two-component response regulator